MRSTSLRRVDGGGVKFKPSCRGAALQENTCAPLKGKIAVHLRCSISGSKKERNRRNRERPSSTHVRALILSKNCFATGVSTSPMFSSLLLRDAFQYSSCSLCAFSVFLLRIDDEDFLPCLFTSLRFFLSHFA